MKRKVRILLNWDISRQDLLQPFIDIQDEIEFIVIWKGKRDDKPPKHPFEEIFFDDYRTPYAILRKIKPDKILFFGIDSYPQIALNLAARNLNIPTFTMHHGIYSGNVLEINQRKEELGIRKKGKLMNSFSSLYFYISALRLKNIDQLFRYLTFPWIRHKRNIVVALEKHRFEGRLPTKFIQLSPHNAISTKRINHLQNDERLIYIGHPFFDQILNDFNKPASENSKSPEKYFLLIDFPNIESNIAFKILGAEGKQNLYKRLSSIAKSMGCRLKIKLHPYGYNSPHNYTEDNIDLVYETNIASLIFYAEKCFSFYSSLLVPVIFAKRYCYVFDVGLKMDMQDELVELDVVKRLRAESFVEEDIREPATASPENFRIFLARYLYLPDASATLRLKKILLN